MGPGFVVRPLERFSGRVVYDLDDDLFSLTPSMEGKGRLAQWLYGPQQAERLVRRADAIVVSTKRLVEALPSPHGPVEVLPTVPNVSMYRVSTNGGEPGLVGWAGTTGGLRYLDPLRDVFAELQASGKGELCVVSSEPWGGPSTFVPWREEEEPTMFANWAIGIMPLPDTEYAKAKAGYKLLQYMASGVACIASPVGVNSELIEASGAGLLASTPSEWKSAIDRLLSDVELRMEMGRAGRAFIEHYANPAHHAAVLSKLLTDQVTM
jgi:glycosyltransferase involved in cell wall biosynthesis